MKKYILFFIAYLFLTSHVDAQLRAGNKRYDRMAYATAIKKYERVVKKNDSSVEGWNKLGDCYRFIGDYSNAERAYAKIINGPVQPEVYLYYAEALMQNEKYTEAKVWLEKYNTVMPSDVRGANLLSGIHQMSNYKSMEGIYKVTKTNVNSNESDIAPIIYNGGIVFASNRPVLSWVKKNHSWTGKSFYRLYHAKGEDALFMAAEEFAPELRVKFHNGPVTFSKVGTTMYFTKNNIEDGKIRKDIKSVTRLKIFSSNYSNGEWGIEIPFPYNSDDYSCAHPSLSVDGSTLYFASDMPGGKGGMDIWKCEWNGSSWDKPINLGDKVNTKGNEVFPYISSDNSLYFSSDGLLGIGGLDLYYIEKSKDGHPQNLGIPMNSAGDDFGICLGSSNDNGYFTSNRKSPFENDDIYYFSKKCVKVNMIVKDETTNSPLPNTDVSIMENGSDYQQITTDSTGKITICLNPLRSYDFIAAKEDYTENKLSLSNKEIADASKATSHQVSLSLTKNIANVEGFVRTADKQEPKANLEVVLTNLKTKEERISTTDTDGYFRFDDIPLNTAYQIKTSAENCGEVSDKFHTQQITGETTISVSLAMLCKGSIIKIDNIYYDYNKFEIREDAALELDKVVALMNENPSMKIELRSHTDSRGNDAYNLKLSDSRARAAMNYMISKGIESSRLKSKGYGELELLNQCKNGVECDEKEHEVNRRTEFKILEM